ncbi:MAG: hypothetical protein ACO1TE_17355 [Prosthecobacter sp.]
MKLLSSVLSFFLVTVALARLDPESVPVAASDRFRKTLLAAKDIVVYEGLPHQMWQPDQLAAELRRKDVTKIGSFHFYTPAVNATNAEELKRLLGPAASVEPYIGPKNCGGYHPDYCVSWTHQGATFHAQVCFGCHEIVFLDGKDSFTYELAAPLKAPLKRYASKRPAVR